MPRRDLDRDSVLTAALGVRTASANQGEHGCSRTQQWPGLGSCSARYASPAPSTTAAEQLKVHSAAEGGGLREPVERAVARRQGGSSSERQLVSGFLQCGVQVVGGRADGLTGLIGYVWQRFLCGCAIVYRLGHGSGEQSADRVVTPLGHRYRGLPSPRRYSMARRFVVVNLPLTVRSALIRIAKGELRPSTQCGECTRWPRLRFAGPDWTMGPQPSTGPVVGRRNTLGRSR